MKKKFTLLVIMSLCLAGWLNAEELSPENAEEEANAVETISILRAEIADLKSEKNDGPHKTIAEELAELRKEVDLLKKAESENNKFEMEKELSKLRAEVATLKGEVDKKESLLKKQSELITKVLNLKSKQNSTALSALRNNNYSGYTTTRTTSNPFGNSTTTRTITGSTFGTGSTTIVVEKHIPTTPTVIYVRQAPPPIRHERRTRSPGKYYTWGDGYWHWSGYRWVWIPGKWVYSPKHTIKWTSPKYIPVRDKHRDPTYRYEPGKWIRVK